MPDRLAATRTGLTMALAYTLPLMLWLLGQVALSSDGRFDLALPLRDMMPAALLLQSCALAVGLLWMMRFAHPLDRCCAAAMLLLVPGPLYAIAGLSGAVGLTALAAAAAALTLLAFLLHGLYTLCLSLTAAGQFRSLLMASTQMILLGLCWHFRNLWLQVLAL